MNYRRMDILLAGNIGIVLLVVSVLQGFFAYHSGFQAEYRTAEKLQDQLVATVEAQAEVALFARNEKIALGVIDGLLVNPAVQAVRLQSDEEFRVEKGKTPVLDFSTARRFDLYSPMAQDQIIGHILLQQDTDWVVQSAVRQALHQTMVMLFHVLLVTLIVMVVIRQRLVKPVTRIIGEIEKITPGSSQRLSESGLRSSLEIQTLIAGTNRLLEATTHAFMEQKRLEQVLQDHTQQLEFIVDQRTAGLKAAQEDLQKIQDELTRSEARATMSTLIASVSHELSTPLGNGILAASQLMEQSREFQQVLDQGNLRRSDLGTYVENQRVGGDLLLRNLERAQELLKKFRQVAADQASEQRRSFELREFIQEVIATLSPSLKRQPHKIDIEVDSSLVFESYPGPLGQVLINLINNAYLHAFENRPDGLISIKASRGDDGMVTLVFKDNGCGMNRENREKIFQPFFSTKIGCGGTGLGMSIIDNLVRKTLGGSVNVDSEPGVGTQITIRLPVVAPQPEAGTWS